MQVRGERFVAAGTLEYVGPVVVLAARARRRLAPPLAIAVRGVNGAITFPIAGNVVVILAFSAYWENVSSS